MISVCPEKKQSVQNKLCHNRDYPGIMSFHESAHRKTDNRYSDDENYEKYPENDIDKNTIIQSMKWVRNLTIDHLESLDFS